MSEDSDEIRRREERKFQIELARAQIRIGIQTNVGVGFITTGLAIGATTISLGTVNTLEKVVQYLGYFILMVLLIVVGIGVFAKAKNLSEKSSCPVSYPRACKMQHRDIVLLFLFPPNQ